jgi:hypothetical protein
MAAPAATVRELHARADKQLETIYKAVGSVKDIGYHKFSVQLSRQAYAYEWEPAIMNLAVPALTPAEITAADLLNTADGIKNKLDRRNAFLVILNATDGHPVENLLESMLPGDPRLAFNTLHSYFHPGTIAGLQGAYVNFFTSTMATSGTTIVSWVSHVSRGARIVRESGGQADETAEVSILLKGLLPEFKQIKTLLNQNRTLTLPLAVSTLMDFARDENILELSKGTNTNKSNVFTVSDRQDDRVRKPGPPTDEDLARMGQEECRMYKQFKCPFGDRCYRKHVGEGGNQKDNHRRKKQAPAPTPSTAQVDATPACHFCLDGRHEPQHCPTVSSTEINYTYLVGASEPVDPVDTERSERLKSVGHSQA